MRVAVSTTRAAIFKRRRRSVANSAVANSRALGMASRTVTRRPKYACQACAGEVVQAPTPERLIESGIPTEALVAHVLVAKYADHTPLYRQAQIYARQGVTLDRSTLADWVGRAAFALRPARPPTLV